MSDRGERRRRGGGGGGGAGDDAATFRSNETNGEYQDIVQRAARTIERAWCSYRDKQMFRLLKHSLCAAEHSLSKDILRKVVPKESKLLDDPIFKVKIKFRFAGQEFPPYIVFKIYTKTHNNQQAKYINGRSVITSSPTAAQEACSQMGNRKYFNLIILDELQQQPDGRVADPESVVSLRDYMQYSSNLDNMPAYLGGRSNSWRRLNLDDLPKHTVFYDVMNYALNKKMSTHLFKQLPVLLQQPNSLDVQMAQMKVISKIDTSIIENNLISYSTSTYKSLASSQTSSRRSKKTMDKVSRMKKAYTMSMARSETVTSLDNTGGGGGNNSNILLDDSFKIPDELNDDFEAEVKNLYTWTKNLTLSDEYLNTPRPTSQH